MSTTTLIEPAATSAVHDLPSVGEMRDEIRPLIGAVVVAGPPMVFLAGPLTVGTLMLAGPFALMVTLVLVAIVAAAALVALAGVIVAAPYLLVRHLRGHRRREVHAAAPARHLVALRSRLGAA
jgi:hypothetical protein